MRAHRSLVDPHLCDTPRDAMARVAVPCNMACSGTPATGTSQVRAVPAAVPMPPLNKTSSGEGRPRH
eukprot:361975-Chlamydomonas_euryale.AAC.2